MLRAEAVTVSKKSADLVRDVSLTAEPGKIIALLGPNGSGKTTLLRVLAGELRPTQGAVTWQGRPLDGYASDELARQRAFLPQESALLFPFTVLQVVTLGRAPHTGGRAETPRDLEICEKALEQVGMGAFADRSYLSLSGGEKQRVQLARILAQIWEPPGGGQPRLLLMDEPTAALDLEHQSVVTHLARAWAAAGTSVVFSTHDPNQALRHADEAILMRGGEVMASGLSEAVLTPARLKRAFNTRTELLQGKTGPVLVLE